MFSEIDTALRKRLNSLSGSHTIAWEGVEETFVARAITLVPINIASESSLLTTDKDQENPGTYRIVVYVPTNEGTKTLIDKIDSIANHFSPYVHLTENGQEVSILAISRGVMIKERSHLVCNVDIRYIAYTSNTLI